jgi:hypothetical protein
MRFRWSAKHHRTPERNTCPTAAPLDATVVAEADAILEGRVVDRLWAAGAPIPAWAWLNARSHRPIGEIGDLIGVACDQPGDRWADTVVDIAVGLSGTGPAQAARIQADLFVAAELELLAGRGFPDGPGQIARAVRRRLASDTGRPSPNLRNRRQHGADDLTVATGPQLAQHPSSSWATRSRSMTGMTAPMPAYTLPSLPNVGSQQ